MAGRKLDLIFRTLVDDKTKGFSAMQGSMETLKKKLSGTSLAFKSVTRSEEGFFKSFKRNLQNLDKSLEKTTGSIQKLSFSKNMEHSATGITGAMGVGGLTAGVGSALSLKTAADFQTNLAQMQVSVKEVGVSFNELKNQAIKLGDETQFTGGEAARAMVFLGSGGWNSSQVKDTAPTVLGLTGAARIKLEGVAVEEVSKSLVDAMNAFQLPSSFAEKFGDQLSFGFSESNQDFIQMMENFRKFAGTAKVSGISHTTAIAASMGLSNLGVKSEIAGTSLASFLSRMQNLPKSGLDVLEEKKVSKKDWAEFVDPKTGKINDLFKLFEILGKYSFKPGQIAELLGDEAGKNLKGLVDPAQIEKMRVFKKTLDDDGENAVFKGRMQTLNSASLAGLNGQMEKLSSNIDTLSIRFGETGLLKLSENVVGGLSKIVGLISGLPQTVLAPLAFAIAGFSAYFSLKIVGRLASLLKITSFLPNLGPLPFKFLATPLNGFVWIFRLTKNLLPSLLGLGGLVSGLVVGLGYLVWFVTKNWETVKARFPILEETRLKIIEAFSWTMDVFNSVFNWMGNLLAKIKDFIKSGVHHILGENVKLNPFAEDLAKEPAKAPELAGKALENIVKKEETKEKKIKVVISGENMPKGVSVKAEVDRGRKFELPLGMSMEFAG